MIALARKRLQARSWIHIAMAVVIAALLIVIYANAPSFFRINNLINVLVQTSILGILAIGLSFVFISGGIDLSMPATLALAGIVGTIVMRDTQMVWIGPAAMLAIGAAIGLFNGIAVGFLRMAPFVVTLATMTVVGGFSVWITASQSVYGYPVLYEDIFLYRLIGLPVSVWIFFAVTLAAATLTDRSAFGRRLRSVGFNMNAALVARIPVRRVIVLSYVLAGLAAGLTAVLLVARLGSASAKLGSDALLLDIISACVIGRVSIYGGIGSPVAVAIGALVVTLITNALNMFGISFFASLVVKGAIILLLVYADSQLRSGSGS